MRCTAQTHKNRQCSHQAVDGNAYCKIHVRQKAFVFNQQLNDQAREEWKKWNLTYLEDDVPMPVICYGLVCGAKTRSGTACRRRDLYNNGRCKLHGGLSTGPKTPDGKKRSGMNLPWKRSKGQ